MYTTANAIRDLGILAAAWLIAGYSLIQMMDAIDCNGHGCTGRW